MQQPRAVFRVPLGRSLTVVTLLLVASALGGLIVAHDWATLIRSWPLLALAGFVSWMLFWRPRVIVDDHVVWVINVALTWRIPLVRLKSLEVRFGVTLGTDEGTVTAWAASAPGRHEALRLSRGDFTAIPRRSGVEQFARPAEATSTESGAAAFVIAQRWADVTGDSASPEPKADSAHEKTSRTWHTASLLVSGLLGVATIITLTLP